MTGYEVAAAAIYVLLCAWVAVSANRKGKYGWAWFVLAIVITPLVAAIVLAILPRKSVFAAEGAYRGVPYYSRPSGEVVALIEGSRVSFASVGEFRNAMDERGWHG